jgi:type VII secretion effector (TIGR04197 family)
MSRIRLNTEDLKNKAKDFDSAAEAIKRAGDDILAAAMAMPSYDGQLSGPARKAGYEIQKQARELSSALAGDAESLRRTAQAFEEVDNQTIDILEKNSVLLSAAFIPDGPRGEDGGPIRKGGNPDLLCYYDYGDTIIIWRFGESVIITVTDENRAMVEQYIKAVDDFCKALAGILDVWRDLALREIGTVQLYILLQVLVVIGLISPQIVVWIAAEANIPIATLDKYKAVAEGVVDVAGLGLPDILNKLGIMIDPLEPNAVIEDLNKLVECGQDASQAYSDAESAWSTLNPEPPTPSSSGPTPVPAPTPPTSTETPTPSGY